MIAKRGQLGLNNIELWNGCHVPYLSDFSYRSDWRSELALIPFVRGGSYLFVSDLRSIMNCLALISFGMEMKQSGKDINRIVSTSALSRIDYPVPPGIPKEFTHVGRGWDTESVDLQEFVFLYNRKYYSVICAYAVEIKTLFVNLETLKVKE